jgi:hypothetical protein
LSWFGSDRNLQFAINATPVPKSSAEILFGVGGIFFLGFGRWKAKTI